MGIYLADQALVFLQSILVGAALGLFYDVFRISRVAFPTATGVIMAEDVFFFTACAVVTFFFGLTAIDGALRFFLLIGELLGAILYYFTLGRLVMSISKKIVETIKWLLRFILKWILRPIWTLIYRLVTLILVPFGFLWGFFKKNLQKTKFRLKVGRKVLYNQLAGCFTMKRAANKRKVRKNERTKKGPKKS